MWNDLKLFYYTIFYELEELDKDTNLYNSLIGTGYTMSTCVCE